MDHNRQCLKQMYTDYIKAVRTPHRLVSRYGSSQVRGVWGQGSLGSGGGPKSHRRVPGGGGGVPPPRRQHIHHSIRPPRLTATRSQKTLSQFEECRPTTKVDNHKIPCTHFVSFFRNWSVGVSCHSESFCLAHVWTPQPKHTTRKTHLL